MPRWMKSAAITAAVLNILFSNCPAHEGCQGQEAVKWEGGDGNGEGSLDPSKIGQCCMKSPQQEAQEA